MDLVSVGQFFNLAKVLFYDGFNVDLACNPSKDCPAFASVSLLITIEPDERIIKYVENKVLVNLGCDYKITRKDVDKFITLFVTTL